MGNGCQVQGTGTGPEQRGAAYMMLKQPRILLVTVLCIIGLQAVTQVQAESLAKSRATADALLDNIDQATWLSEGDGKHIVYIFFDPDCPYCHKLYESLRPLIGEMALQLRWIPVGMLAASSPGKAAAILQADNPLDAFHKNEDNFNFSDNRAGGAVAPAVSMTDKTRLDLAANLSVLEEQNLFAVPVAVFQASDGQGFMFQGAPPDKTLRQLLQYVQ